ncbi:MAG TPA: DUF4440 domain-containing protein [Pyrinomonadaceae bacterium]|nr:DUF4440 domain-containing protein [Pyrinomonadaceae bacterium]
MQKLLVIICVCLMSSLTFGQTSTGPGKDDKAKEELRKLHSDYQEAGSKRDRAALERLFADGYVWVQGNGRVTTKAQHIENILGNTSEFSGPAPSFDQLTLYGDTAILRVTERTGLFATTVFARTDGRWQFVHAQSTLLPLERKAVELDPKALDAFVGSYEFGPGAVATATKEGDALMWKGGRRPKVKLIPLSDTRFFVAESGVEMTFHKDDKGRATGVTLRIGTCQDSEAKRVE